MAPILSDAECLHEDSEAVHGRFNAPDNSDVPLDEVDAHCEQMANGSGEISDDSDIDHVYVPDV